MYWLAEVLTRLAVPPPHLVGDVFGDERPGLVEEFLFFDRERDAGKVHQAASITRVRKRSRVSSAWAMLSPGRWTLTQLTPSFASRSRPSR